MSRRAYKTVNLPREVVEWIDSLVSPQARKGKPGPLGIESRDEFVRIAVAILGAAIQPHDRDQLPLDIINHLIQEILRARGDERTADSS